MKIFMNLIIGILILFLTINVQADEITCFSGKTRIYHGYAHHFEYSDQTVSFHQDKDDRRIIVKGECVIELLSLID